jgi:hypothetical protein
MAVKPGFDRRNTKIIGPVDPIDKHEKADDTADAGHAPQLPDHR